MTPADALEQAADLIENVGHCKGISKILDKDQDIEMNRIAEDIERAADLIESQGLCKNQLSRIGPDGQMTHCAVGALWRIALNEAGYGDLTDRSIDWIWHRDMRDSVGGGTTRLSLFCRVQDTVAVLNQVLGGYISLFNDDPSRTADQVVEFLKDTAKDLRNRDHHGLV